MTRSAPQTFVAGTGRYLPQRAVDNFDLYEMPSIREAFDVEMARTSLRGIEPDELAGLSAADVFDRWSVQVTGIRERRIMDPSVDRSAEWMCAEAGRAALAAAGLEASDLDLLLVASLTEREIVPNAACTVGDLLGIPEAPGFVLNAACAGFLHALAAGYAFVTSGSARNVLVVSGDFLTGITDYSDPKTAVLFGDGAGAAVLSADGGPGRVLAAPYTTADYSPTHLNLKGQAVMEPGDAIPKLSMGGGPNVLRNAIKSMVGVAERALERTDLSWADVDFVVPHQANRRITTGIAKVLALPKGRVIDVIERYGNVSASTVPIALDEAVRGMHGPVPPTANIVLTAVGGGYTSGAAVIEWSGGSEA
ncbi:MAG: beta-ketoacyl-ACP synthase 3 [Candidatus Palauibacterales bacterium]|nr:beta-ketoacyl-ACP synthase 3 [Candidatus Palauibacterales bacterium]